MNNEFSTDNQTINNLDRNERPLVEPMEFFDPGKGLTPDDQTANNNLIEPMEFRDPSVALSPEESRAWAMELIEQSKQASNGAASTVQESAPAEELQAINVNRSNKVMPLDWLNKQLSTSESVNAQMENTQPPVEPFVYSSVPMNSAAQVVPSVNIPAQPKKAKYSVVEQKTSPGMLAHQLMNVIPFKTVGNIVFYFNGRYYQRASELEVRRLIRQVLRAETEAATPNLTKQIYEFLLIEPTIVVPEDAISRNEVSFLNGVLDIKSGEFRPHSPASFITYGVNCNYGAQNLSCLNFCTFLEQVTGGDKGIQYRIWEMLGYVLTPDTGAKKFFLLQGCSDSGKSVLSTLIRSFFNVEAVSSQSVHALSGRFNLSELAGKAICVSPDLPSDPLDSKSVSVLKQLTGDDLVSGEVKNKESRQFLGRVKFILATNHPLLIRAQDDAFVKRVMAIPFCYAVPESQKDTGLLLKLQAERDAIVTYAMAAYFQLRNRNYQFSGEYELNSASVLHQSSDALNLDSCIRAFAENNFEATDEGGIYTSEIHAEFCKQYGFVPVIFFSQLFNKHATKLYHSRKSRKKVTPGTNALAYFSGIKFKEEVQQ